MLPLFFKSSSFQKISWLCGFLHNSSLTSSVHTVWWYFEIFWRFTVLISIGELTPSFLEQILPWLPEVSRATFPILLVRYKTDLRHATGTFLESLIPCIGYFPREAITTLMVCFQREVLSMLLVFSRENCSTMLVLLEIFIQCNGSVSWETCSMHLGCPRVYWETRSMLLVCF